MNDECGHARKKCGCLYICMNFVQIVTTQLAYDHIADFIAAMNPAKVLELRAPEAARLRRVALIELEKEQ
jgi:hypothetical protein